MTARKKNISLKPGKNREALSITHPNAAGIDIGSATHFVAVPPDRDDDRVRAFPSFTVDLYAIADWLKACKVDCVAMESTGVYWIPLFEVLEGRAPVRSQAGRRLFRFPGDPTGRGGPGTRKATTGP